MTNQRQINDKVLKLKFSIKIGNILNLNINGNDRYKF